MDKLFPDDMGFDSRQFERHGVQLYCKANQQGTKQRPTGEH